MSLAEPTLITIRESLEAFLIVTIFAGLATKMGFPHVRKYLLWGAGAAVAASVIAGVLIDDAVRELSGEWVEGVASLVAVGILTYMVFWMYRHTLDLVAGFRTRLHEAVAVGRPSILFLIAFVAVAREGLETVFLFAALAPSTSALTLVIALLLGLAISGTLAFLLFTGIVRLSLKKFFATTGVLLVFFAGGLLMTTVHEFSEVGVIPETPEAWNTEFLLDQHSIAGSIVKAVFGYRESPTILEAALYFLYVLGVGGWYVYGLIGRRPRTTPTAEEPPASPAPTPAA